MIIEKKKKFYQKLLPIIQRKFYMFENDYELLDEAKTGMEFYNLISSQGYKKDELFRVKIPIESLNPRKFKNAYKIDLEIEIPIDITVMEKYINEYVTAIKTNSKLKQKYQKMAYWYNDFNKLIFDNLSESDACLFITAVAYCSANTAVDVNIIEATKLFTAVKTDFNRGNIGKKILEYIANNINSVDNNKNILKLQKLVDSNSSYAQVITPKNDPTMEKSTSKKEKIFKEISVSGAKLTNFNRFVLYFLKKNGKVTKRGLINDIKSGILSVGGTKIYSFLLNLIDPDFEWETIESDEVKGTKIQPATIDRWMIRMFFQQPIKRAMEELVSAEIVDGTPAAQKVFVESSIKILFQSDVVRANVVKIINEKVLKYKKEVGLTASQFQAFGWVRIREDSGIPSAEFSSFEDVVNFTQKISQKIDKINPQLNFINSIGNENKVLTAIKLLSNMSRPNMKDVPESEKSLENWLSYDTRYPMKDKKIKVGGVLVTKYSISFPTQKENQWKVFVTSGTGNEKIEKEFTADSKFGVVKNARDWIREKQKAEKIEIIKNKKKKKINIPMENISQNDKFKNLIEKTLHILQKNYKSST